ncbi:peptide ABC transporter permease [Sphaerisporangium siamense]|uniref:Peptide/nickel transport system permease protein n=1 Tax=Sphaerisporangium siamense TaxID=795645 RepID=A0A7W7DFJ4_9ACTN|nr:ABC transporter permease [Sphaerisporangium siamense]MBB4704418.1 peptide/nickel transport system permease protein [Sphaerisporangium siamense]GII84898.1 peptide ABC transporter permease [Sphaerisporangium siamense]
MPRYVALRLAATMPVLAGVSIVLFALIRLIPGDPSHAILMSMADPGADMSRLREDLRTLRAELGLDRPYATQYLSWLGGILSGDLGTSMRSGEPVLREILARAPATAELAGAALVVMVVVAAPTAIAGAVRHGGLADRVGRVVALAGVCVPGFLSGMLFVYAFAVGPGWLPTSGRGGLAHLVLPGLTLGLALAGGTSRLLRAGLLDALSQTYIVTAEAKGLPWRVIVLRHALRNALPPVLTNSGLLAGGLLGGSVIVETVFSWPGVGRYIVDAIGGRDYPVIQGFTLVMTLTYVAVNLLTDIGYRVLDPRVRVEGTRP